MPTPDGPATSEAGSLPLFNQPDPPPPVAAAIRYTEPKAESRPLVRGTVADLKFIDSLQKKFGKSLGFLPTQALEKNLEAGNVVITNENDTEAGYLLVRPILGWQPLMASIVQAAVCMDAQRRHHGLRLLLQIESEARKRGQVAMQANCAIGVEANDFWRAAGFKPVVHMTPNTKSGREIICWRKPLTRSLPAWFTDMPTRAGHRCRVPTSQRDLERDPKTLAFAKRFTAAKNLVQGNPELPNSGIILSTSPEAQLILNGGKDAVDSLS